MTSGSNTDSVLIIIRIYYQDDPKRLPVCTLPIHSLLHIADCIRGWGPVWCYWSFPMERFCGHLKHGGVSSKRHPYSSLDRYLTDWATLWHIGNTYGIQDELKLRKPRKQHYRVEGCKYSHTSSTTQLLKFKIDQSCELVAPCKLSQSLYVQDGTKFHPAVVIALKDWFSRLQLSQSVMQACFDSAVIQEWKKVRRIDSEAGDLMCASAHSSGRDSRDSSYIRVWIPLMSASSPLLTTTQYLIPSPGGGTVTYYGKLEHIITITFPESHESLQPVRPASSIFALIHRCTLKEGEPQLADLDIHFFSKERQSFDVIDITWVQCLVGRVIAGGNNWAIIDRSGKLVRGSFEDQDDEEQEPA